MQVEEITIPYSILHNNKPLNDSEERVEIFSKAFYEISKNYFKQRFQIENEIEVLKERQKRYVGVGVFIFILGILLAFIKIWLILIICLGVIVAIYNYKKYRKLIENKVKELFELKPEGKIKFISKIYLPFYMVPYNGESIILDARNLGEKQTIELKQVDLMSLLDNINALESETKILKTTFDYIADIDTVKSYDERVLENKTLETRILEILESMENVLNNLSTSYYEFYLHKPESKTAQAISQLFKEGDNLFQENSNVMKIPPKLSIDDGVKIVDDLRDIELEALERGVVDTVQDCIR